MEAYCNATGMKQAMMMSEHASSDQHFKLYATLTALLPEELLDVIRRHLNDNATSGGQAWAALRTRFEGGHLGRISDMYAVLQSGQQRTETAEAYYHRLDNAFLDLVAEAEEHEDVEAPSHNQVVTQFLAGLRPEYEPIIGILQVTAEHEGRAITWEGDCLKLAQNYSKRIEKNHASEPSAEGYIASGGTKRSAHLATGDGSGPRRLGAPLRGGCWQCGGPHFKRDCPQRPRGNRRQAAADPAPAAFVADEEEEHVAFMAENAGNTPPAKRVALSLLDDEWDDWAPEPGTLLYDLFGGEYESEEDVRPAEAAGAVAQANEREHDLDSHNMDEIISLSGLSDCFGMSDDEAGSASGGMGGSARVVTKSDSAYLLDAVALASVVVDARGACMLGLNDDLGSYPDMWVKDSGAYPHMVADSDSFVEYEQLAPPVEVGGICCLAVGRGTVWMVVRADGGEVRSVLRGVLHVPDLPGKTKHGYRRLFSQRLAQERGASFHYTANGDSMVLRSAGRDMTVPIGRAPGSNLYAFRSRILKSGRAPSPADVVALQACGKLSKLLWHRRLGHLHAAGMDRLLAESVSGITFAKDEILPFCDCCALAKSHEQPRSRIASKRPTGPLQKFGADIWGPVGVTSIGGFRYVFGMTDYYSAYGWVVFMKSKDEAPRALLLVVRAIRRVHPRFGYDKSTARLRLDNDSVFQSADFRSACDGLHFVPEFSAPYCQWQNGLQERMWLTLSEMTVAMLLHAGLGREFWALAFCAAMHIRNNVYSRGVGSVPYRRHTGKTPDVAGLRVFGCPAYVHVDAGNRRKLDAKAFRGVFVGYGQESHTYLVWNPATRRVVASRNVIFDEGWRDAASSSKGGSGGDAAASLEMFPQYQALLDNSGVGSTSDASRLQEITEAHQRVVDETDDVEEELEIEEEPLTAEELELGPQQPTLELTQLETNEGTDDGGQEEPIVQRAERDPYPARSRRAPGQWWVVHPENPNDDAAAMMAAAFAAVTQGVDEPITLKQALSGPFKEQWAQAVESEFNSLEKQGTWVVCELPEERTAIPSKWVFKVKYNADGSIARFKARLVVQGCRQRHGIDYAETFAPTVKFTTIRVLFAIAVQYGWNIHQVDVDTAFLYAPVEEEIYMRPPPGYEQYDARGRPMVLRLLKSLYGLKQSPRNWHNTLHKFLVCYGFQQLKSDPGAYVYWQGGQLICILVVYVDDMIFAFKDAVWAADFKTALGARFDIKDLGVCAWALGMAVERDWDNATLKVHQAKYIDDMVHKFNLADAYAVSTPAEVGADVPGSNKPLAAEMPYQALVGSLLYAMVATRPDIAEAVSKLCRVMAKPEERHWQAAKRVLRYLKGTKTLGLTFSGGKADGLLHGYCDADWAGDVVSRRSTTGFVFMLCGAAVSWKSQLQATVALSTAEAEYMALCAAVCEALFLRELLRELCCAQSEATVIFEDNQSCIALTRNPMTHGRSKHIAIKYHFTREKVLSGEVAIEYCPTAQMVADALTKALGRLKHAEFAMQMLGA